MQFLSIHFILDELFRHMKKLFVFLAVFVSLFFLHTPAYALPPNFQRQLIVSTGLNAPTGFAIAPDGRIFITEREGGVRVVKNGQLLDTPFTTLPSAATGDRGLAGITFDPDFLHNHYVYFYYTDAVDLHNKLVRFDASGDVATSGPLILYETPDESFSLHIGGTVQFGPEGKIYVSIGDNGTFPNAQDITNPHGKVIRLNPDGTIPTDNPFYNIPGAAQEIWAMGFRNPFRFQFDSATGDIYEGDVGEASWEEINHIIKGGNYGWPDCEGYCNPSNPKYIDPIFAWPHDPNIAGGSAASVGGPVYHGDMFPASFAGKLFFGDYAQGWIKYMNTDGSGVTDFETNSGAVVDMHVDPTDGSLYYLDIFPGALYKVIYSTGNSAPIAQASADATSGPSPLTVHFSSAGTTDADGDTLTYFWDFGDGTNSTETNPTKVYSTNGTYTVELHVSDGQYTDLAVPIVIQVGIPPTVNIISPLDKSTYKAGDTINYQIQAQDSAGNNLSGNSVQTTVVFHHQTHIHPFLGPIPGTTGQFTIPTTGESSPVTWYEIDVTATDGSGLATTKIINIYPIESNLTFTSNPTGLQILLDGIPTTTPLSTAGVVNFQRTLSIHPYQQLNGNYYTFHNWSDGGAITHTIATPDTDATYSAQFDTAAPFHAEYYDNSDLTGNPTIVRDEPAINFDYGDTGSPDPSISHDTFSARWTANQFFAAGNYTFTTTTDDGVRLYIDGNLVIDKWIGQPTTSYTTAIALTEGIHEIKMEYFQSYGGAVAKLSWDLSPNQLTPTPTPTISPTAEPTSTPSVTPTVTPTTVPTVTPTPTLEPSATPTQSPSQTPAPSSTPSNTPAPTTNPTNTPVPSETPSLTPQITITITPPTPTPTSAQPTPEPTTQPTPTPTNSQPQPTPTIVTTLTPSPVPTITPIPTQPQVTPFPTLTQIPTPTPSISPFPKNHPPKGKHHKSSWNHNMMSGFFKNIKNTFTNIFSDINFLAAKKPEKTDSKRHGYLSKKTPFYEYNNFIQKDRTECLSSCTVHF